MTSSPLVPTMRECSLPTFAAQLTDLMDGVSGLAVALSGGLDSCVLLSLVHALQQQVAIDYHGAGHFAPFQLYAIHVNHGLSPNAGHWEAFCRETCDALGIELLVERITIDRNAGPSLENLAREQRYAAFQRHLQPGHGLLMAHHLDDQSETFLLRTLRGAGPRGLGAMPARRPLGQGWLLRPLLGCPRAELERYARQQHLRWIEDESNQSLDFDRNYLRRELLPLIESRWPGYRQTWHRSATLAAEADELLAQLADLDLADIPHSTQAGSLTLNCYALSRLVPSRQRNVLRRWLRKSNIPEPGYHLLQQIVHEVIAAAADTQPQVSWSVAEQTFLLRRHQGVLHLSTVIQKPFAENTEIPLIPGQPVSLPDKGTVTLILSSCESGHGLPRTVDRFTVRYRRGGESLRLQGRRLRSLKKILQESNLPPWQRERLPLLFADDELVAVADIGVAEGWSSVQFIWCAP